MVAEGRFGLDDTIERWFPALNHAEHITLRMALNHRSGLPEYEDLIDVHTERTWTPNQIIDFALNTGRQTPPGGSSYTNLGYVLAGLIIERETGRSYAHEMRSRFFDPLGLKDCWSASAEAFPIERLAHCVMHDGEPPIDSTSWFPFSAMGPAGDLVATPSDLVRWLDALFEHQVLEDAQLFEMARAVEPASLPSSRISHNGAGILVSTFEDGLVVKGHLGQLRGFVTMMARHEPSGITAALAQSSSATDVTDPHCAGIHDVFAALFRAAGARPSA
jgi:D-alanyl-D-alanine carboxypeptidase